MDAPNARTRNSATPSHCHTDQPVDEDEAAASAPVVTVLAAGAGAELDGAEPDEVGVGDALAVVVGVPLGSGLTGGGMARSKRT